MSTVTMFLLYYLPMMDWTLLKTLLAGLAVAQGCVSAAPMGALQARDELLEAQEDTHVVSLGAPRSFSLFFPELPRSLDNIPTIPSITSHPLTNTQSLNSQQEGYETPVQEKKVLSIETTTVPVIEIPRKSDNMLDENGLSRSFLDMFPEDLLSSNKKVKPVKVHIIEHDYYIDYEIEFIELTDNMDFSSEEITSDIHDYSMSSTKESRMSDDLLSTDVGQLRNASNVSDTFLGLLEEARLRHKSKTMDMKVKKTTGVINESTIKMKKRKQE